MTVSRYPTLLAEVVEIMSSMANDWEYGNTIDASTLLFSDLGFESLDLVVLGTSLQDRYGRMPFAEFLADIGARSVKDVTVGELVTYVVDNAENVQTGRNQ